jgi:2-polyprenyl-6-hydroxyphenyl methylase/3-demethylubiquinone-9 3-methyltransferase
MGDSYIDDVWAAVPEGAEPEHFSVRRDFLLAHLPEDARVLDVGCGEGAFSAAIAASGASPIAVDVADEPLRRLRERFPEVADVRRAEVGKPLPLRDGEADAVWAGEVVEHVVDVGAFCAELRRVLKPAGPLILTTPDHPRRLLARFALSPRRFDEHFAPYADHVRFFTARTLIRVLEDAGFATVALTRSHGHLLACAF